MKRNLIISVVLAAICMTMTNCKNTDLYDPEGDAKRIVDEYTTKFKDYVGVSISPDQDWGFGATTRAQAPSVTRAADYVLADDYIKEFTQGYYDAALASLPGSIVNYEFEQRGPFRFDLIYTSTEEDYMEIGYYYYNPKTQTAKDHTDVTLIGSLASDLASYAYFQYTTYSNPTPSQWITPEPWYGYSIWELGTKVYKVHSRMFTIQTGKVPVGYRVGFYVKNNGKTYYSNKYLNDANGPFLAVIDQSSGILGNSYLVGMEDLATTGQNYDCKDVMIAVHKNIETNPDTWPLLVIPEDPTPPTPPQPVSDYWRIIAEDLNVNGENSDFDFNDIVLDVKLTSSGADCILQAAGATLPIRINGEDRLEVHKLFNVDQKIMVNTNASSNGESRIPVIFSIYGSFSSVDDILIQVNKGSETSPNWIPLFAKRGDAACKMVVKDTFVWPDERVSLKKVYPKFVEWVEDPTVIWY